jgi:hypothetical protein
VIARLIAVTALLLMCAALARPVAATESPIRVSRCEANLPRNNLHWVDPWGRPYSEPGTTASVSIDFTNAGTQPATAIDFGLVVSTVLVAEMRDTGTFTPGARISHTLGVSAAALPVRNARCVPLRVKWTDGTYWKSSELHALNATP